MRTTKAKKESNTFNWIALASNLREIFKGGKIIEDYHPEEGKFCIIVQSDDNTPIALIDQSGKQPHPFYNFHMQATPDMVVGVMTAAKDIVFTDMTYGGEFFPKNDADKTRFVFGDEAVVALMDSLEAEDQAERDADEQSSHGQVIN